MPSSEDAAERRREANRRYYLKRRKLKGPACRLLYPSCIPRLQNQLGNARYRYRRKPSDQLAATIARLESEIERLRGGA